MQINAALNLVFPARWIEVAKPHPKDASKTVTVSEPLVWAYHTPIGREVFEVNWRIIGSAYATLFDDPRYSGSAGVRIATLALKDAAKIDDSGLDLSGALLSEIKRLTMIIAPNATGFGPVPVDMAIENKIIDSDDWAEVESALVFFTCAYSMAPRSRQERVATALAPALRGSISPLQAMDFAASLPTSTPAETSAPIISSVPS
jgi:hypothetical protein